MLRIASNEAAKNGEQRSEAHRSALSRRKLFQERAAAIAVSAGLSVGMILGLGGTTKAIAMPPTPASAAVSAGMSHGMVPEGTTKANAMPTPPATSTSAADPLEMCLKELLKERLRYTSSPFSSLSFSDLHAMFERIEQQRLKAVDLQKHTGSYQAQKKALDQCESIVSRTITARKWLLVELDKRIDEAPLDRAQKARAREALRQAHANIDAFPDKFWTSPSLTTIQNILENQTSVPSTTEQSSAPSAAEDPQQPEGKSWLYPLDDPLFILTLGGVTVLGGFALWRAHLQDQEVRERARQYRAWINGQTKSRDT